VHRSASSGKNQNKITAGTARPTTRIRTEIAERFKWNLSHIYSGWSTWEADLQKARELIGRFQELKGSLSQGPEQMLAVNRLSDDLGEIAYRVYWYPYLHSNQDTRDNDAQARLERVNILLADFSKAAAWVSPEILTIPEQTMQEWLARTPELEPYRFGITEVYRKQQHVLDEAGERLIAYAKSFGSTPSQTYTMLADADVTYPEITLSSGDTVIASHPTLMHVLQTNRNQSDRMACQRASASVFESMKNTYAAIYNGLLQRDWFKAQARCYDTTLALALDDNNIPVDVVESLIATARAGAGPLQRYHRLRRKALGLERYRYFDAYLPLVDLKWEVPYDQALPAIIDSVKVFGDDYQRSVQQAFDERWIDVYENEGKRSGAFSAGVYGVHPYMLLNYSDTLSDAFTVAHEMGHTMHTLLSFAHQPFATCSYTIFVAEVASMTNEDLLLDELLRREDDPNRRVTLLQHAIDDISASFYRQATFADFELQAHRAVEKGEPITATWLSELYLSILNQSFGDSLDDHELYCCTWAQIPHFYSTPYYVYQYATAKAASSLIHKMITTGSDSSRNQAVERYLTLLRSGGNDHPIEQLKKAGVDLSTSTPTEALVSSMDQLVTQLEEELGRLGLV
jgi:oligoendopeptidase F